MMFAYFQLPRRLWSRLWMVWTTTTTRHQQRNLLVLITQVLGMILTLRIVKTFERTCTFSIRPCKLYCACARPHLGTCFLSIAPDSGCRFYPNKILPHTFTFCKPLWCRIGCIVLLWTFMYTVFSQQTCPPSDRFPHDSVITAVTQHVFTFQGAVGAFRLRQSS